MPSLFLSESQVYSFWQLFKSLSKRKNRSRTKSKVRTLWLEVWNQIWEVRLIFWSECKPSSVSTTLPSQISMWLMISSAGTNRIGRSWSASEVMVYDPKTFQVKWTKPMRKWSKGITKTQEWQDPSALEAETLKHMNLVIQALCSPHGREDRKWMRWIHAGCINLGLVMENNPWRGYEDACFTL